MHTCCASHRLEHSECGYKLIQYMMSALPVVGSRAGANCDIVVPSETRLLAKSPGEWVASLLRLGQDPTLLPWRSRPVVSERALFAGGDGAQARQFIPSLRFRVRCNGNPHLRA